MAFSLFLETTPTIFANWMNNRTAGAYLETFPTQKGRISLNRARYLRDRNRVVIQGFYIVKQDEETETAYSLSEVIIFEIIPLSVDRIEVMPRCTQNVAYGYFEDLIKDILIRWPDTSSQPEDILREIREFRSEFQAKSSSLLNHQVTIMSLLSEHDRRMSDKARRLIESGQMSKRDLASMLDAIRRAIKYMLKQEEAFQEDVRQALSDHNELLESDASVEHKLEISIPIIPLLLHYRAELSVGSRIDVTKALNHLSECWNTLMDQPE